MPSEVLVELMRGAEEGVVFMGVAFRGLPSGRSRLRLPQSRDRALQGSTHYGYCVHGSHLLPMDHDHGNDRTPATRLAIGIKPVAVSHMLIPEAGPVTERLRVREIDDDKGLRLVRIIRPGSGAVATLRWCSSKVQQPHRPTLTVDGQQGC